MNNRIASLVLGAAENQSSLKMGAFSFTKHEVQTAANCIRDYQISSYILDRMDETSLMFYLLRISEGVEPAPRKLRKNLNEQKRLDKARLVQDARGDWDGQTGHTGEGIRTPDGDRTNEPAVCAEAE